ncbi:uncharacterized protein LOC128205524 isoform X1 [Mya arenaria]|uniref:uncharacterized protein LOC128205524 isoform X1 n=1 Tax=Mya arenaria TaxID=6604 RepID=UPI0022E348EE|nr:uncharacterized protein LOC128205524 isoform X1 [Mya arenaria]
MVSATLASEPPSPACSKYDFEEKVLEKMIRMEFAFEKVLNENKVVSEKMQIAFGKFSEVMKRDFNTIKEENERLHVIVDEMKNQQEQAERKLVSLMEEIERNQTSTLEEVMTDSNNTLEQISASFNNIKDQIATPLVYFHARSPQTFTLSTGEVIVYKTVETNQGNGYSATTGKFAAPVRGLYLFHIHTCSTTNKYAYPQMVKEGSVLIASYQHGNGNYDCASSQTFVQLNAGETVWVKCSGGTTLFENIHRWTSFGGALIHN